MGHGSGARAGHEAHRRQERQRRHERVLRPREHRPVGLRLAVGGQPPVAETTIFGAGSFLAADGKTAQITAEFTQGVKWFNDGVWKDHFIPTKTAVKSDLLAKGNLFQSGNLGMVEIHTWYTCCVNPAPPAKPIVQLGLRGHPVVQRQHDGQAARRHVQHPQDDQAPGRGVQGRHGAGRLRRAADHLRRHAGRPGPPAGRSSTPSTRPTRTRSSTSSLEGDARLRRHPQPPGLGPGLPEGPDRLRPSGQVPHHGRPRHRRRARHAADDPPGHLRRDRRQP